MGNNNGDLAFNQSKMSIDTIDTIGSNLFNLDNNNGNELLEKDNLVTGCLTNK